MNTTPSLVRKYFQINPASLRSLGVISVLLLLVSGCSSSSSKSKPKPPTNIPETIASPAPLDSKPVKMKLIVDSPQSLRVKQGDLIVKGQILVDRSAARQQILARRQKVQQEAVLLAATEDIPVAPLNSTAAEAQVKQAREQVRRADAAIQEFLANSPYTDIARQTLPLPDEEKQLAQLQLAKSNAQVQLQQAIAQLNSLNSTQAQQGQTDSSTKKKRLLNELKTIESQLLALQDIQSPHDAIVEKIEWQKKDKNGMTVELALAVHSLSDPLPPLPSTSNDPLLSVPGSTPALPTGGQPFPNIPPNPTNPLAPSTSTAPQSTAPVQIPTTSQRR